MYDYPFIRAYANWIRSTDQNYVFNTVRRAQKDNAPRTAIYFDGEKWVTLDEIGVVDVLLHVIALAGDYARNDLRH